MHPDYSPKAKRLRKLIIGISITALIILLCTIGFFLHLYLGDTGIKWYTQGIRMYTSGNYEVAVQYFNRSVELDPENIDAIWFLGKSYYKVNEVQKATEKISEAIVKNPSKMDYYNDLITIYTDQLNFPMVIQTLQKVLSRDSNDKVTWLKLGSTYLQVEELDSARFVFNHVLTIDPDNLESRNGLSEVDRRFEVLHDRQMMELQKIEDDLDIKTDNLKPTR